MQSVVLLGTPGDFPQPGIAPPPRPHLTLPTLLQQAPAKIITMIYLHNGNGGNYIMIVISSSPPKGVNEYYTEVILMRFPSTIRL